MLAASLGKSLPEHENDSNQYKGREEDSPAYIDRILTDRDVKISSEECVMDRGKWWRLITARIATISGTRDHQV